MPEAIGGEMEGVGLSAAAIRSRVPWILAKSICDWADGQKHKSYQPLAAGGSSATNRIEAVSSSNWKCGFRKTVAV